MPKQDVERFNDSKNEGSTLERLLSKEKEGDFPGVSLEERNEKR
jgi:hypothetical protein